MRKKLFIFLIPLILIILILCLLLNRQSELTYNNQIQLSDMKTIFNDVYNNFGLDMKNQNVVDYKLEGITIWIDSSSDTLMDTMIETVDNKSSTNNKIISLNYSMNKSRFVKNEGVYKISAETLKLNNRINLIECMDFIGGIDYKSMIKDSNIDFFEIKTDGLYQIIKYPHFVFNYDCYTLKNGFIQKIDKELYKTFKEDDYYLPIIVSKGGINKNKDVDLYNLDISAVILVKQNLTK